MIIWNRTKKAISNLLFCLRLLYDANNKVFMGLLTINMLTTLSPIILLYISKNIYNSIMDGFLGSAEVGKTVCFIVLYFSLNIITSFANDYTKKISTIATQELIKHINMGIMDKSTSIDISYFDIPALFDEVNISRNNAKELHTIVFSLTSIISCIIQFLVSLAVALSINKWLCILVVIACFPKYLFSRKAEFEKYQFEKGQANERRRNSYIYSLFFKKKSAMEIRYYDNTEYFMDMYLNVQKSLVGRKNGLHNKIAIKKILLSIPNIFVKIYINIFVIVNITKEIFSIGDFSYINGIYSSLSSSVERLLSSFAVLEGYDAKISDYKKYFSCDDSINEGLSISGNIESIEFKNVTFRYPNSDEDTLNNISFCINKNEKTMLVGMNGSGKTTIIKLLCGFYLDYSGEILLNGIDIKKYNIKELRSYMATVFQDFTVFSLTLRENIAFGDLNKLNYSDYLCNCLLAASFDMSKGVSLDRYINRDFEIDGIVLSGGQRQKVAIARAYVRCPQIVLMDEPNAALDPISENELLRQFRLLYSNSMLLFVSHRLSNSALMDKIIVLDNGTIIEEGNHEFLMQKKGHYYQMYTIQAEKYQS